MAAFLKFWDTHQLQKKLAVHVLDGIETEASATCGLTHCSLMGKGVG